MKIHRESVVGIQYLRGLAAVAVVIDHSGSMIALPRYFARELHPLFSGGFIGVPIFFVISGVIISIISLDINFNPKVNATDFFYKRFARIVPFMWICVIGYNALSFAGTGVIDIAPLLRGLTLWPVGEVKPNVIWTLRHEFLFYLVFALTMLTARRRLSLLCLWMFLPALLAMSVSAPTPTDGAGYVLVWFLLSPYNLMFGAGFAIGAVYLRRPELFASLYSSNMSTLTALVVLGMYICVVVSGWKSPLAIVGILTLFSSAVCYVGIRAKATDGPLGKAGKVLGDASYSIYLVHNPVLLCQLELSRALGNPVNPMYVMPVSVVSAVIVGIIGHYVVERPVVSYANGIITRRNAIERSRITP